MSQISNSTYFSARAEAAATLAKRATDPGVKRIHETMAATYRSRAAG